MYECRLIGAGVRLPHSFCRSSPPRPSKRSAVQRQAVRHRIDTSARIRPGSFQPGCAIRGAEGRHHPCRAERLPSVRRRSWISARSSPPAASAASSAWRFRRTPAPTAASSYRSRTSTAISWSRASRDRSIPCRRIQRSDSTCSGPRSSAHSRTRREFHYGGNLVFAPDGLLYIGTGDGGEPNDASHRAQNPAKPARQAPAHRRQRRRRRSRGLRHPAGQSVPRRRRAQRCGPSGFRNPWRISLDDPARGGTGALIIGDVGESAVRRVNYEPPAAPGATTAGETAKARTITSWIPRRRTSRSPIRSSSTTTGSAARSPAASCIAAPRTGDERPLRLRRLRLAATSRRSR